MPNVFYFKHLKCWVLNFVRLTYNCKLNIFWVLGSCLKTKPWKYITMAYCNMLVYLCFFFLNLINKSKITDKLLSEGHRVPIDSVLHWPSSVSSKLICLYFTHVRQKYRWLNLLRESSSSFYTHVCTYM